MSAGSWLRRRVPCGRREPWLGPHVWYGVPPRYGSAVVTCLALSNQVDSMMVLAGFEDMVVALDQRVRGL